MENRNVFVFAKEHSDDGLITALSSQDWVVHSARSFEEGSALLKQRTFNVAVTFVEFPSDNDYLHQLEQLLCQDYLVNWILVLPEALPSVDQHHPIYRLIREFCFDYHSLPIKSKRIMTIIGHAYGMAAIARNPDVDSVQSAAKYDIIGNSPVMLTLFDQMEKIYHEDYPVLIEGETGTGKELIANAIHYNSRRATQPLIAVNCGSLAENLVQAELFGYEKGAFTGAHKRKIGRIESAQGGTLFLDEVGDLPMSQQVNLLRFLEQKSIVRVGGDEEISIDVRIIAATHIDLNQAVADGRFREDLYFRLNVLHLKVPALRDREDDIELLARYFLDNFAHEHRQKASSLSLGALQVMRNYDWPGNVRELVNTIRQGCIMSENRLLSPTDLGLDQRTNRRDFTTLEQFRADADRSAIQGCLRQCNYNVTRAAGQLGVSRVTLHRLIDKYQLKNVD